MISFTFKNRSEIEYNSLLDFGIYLVERPALPRAERNFKYIDVEGRDGTLIEDIGTYKNVEVRLNCVILDKDITNAAMEKLNSWLNGEGGELTLSYYADRYFKVKEVKSFAIKESSGILGEFEVTFICEPFKYKLNDLDLFRICEVNVARSGLATNPLESYNYTIGKVYQANEPILINHVRDFIIYNNGTIEAKPILKLYGSGDITITINNNNVTIKNLDEYVIIDSEMMNCYKGTELRNNKMIGDFPILKVGENKFSYIGNLTAFEIKHNTRFL